MRIILGPDIAFDYGLVTWALLLDGDREAKTTN
jgi:hypothetical protein